MKVTSLKKITKFLLVILMVLIIYIFVNRTTYNFVKSLYIPNWQKYVEMNTYLKIQAKDVEKYFIVQDNENVKTYFEEVQQIKFIEDVSRIESVDKSIWVFVRPDDAILKVAKGFGADIIIINSGENIEFYVARFANIPNSCRVGAL